ncbi:MAG: SDR family NAD(P)-dependent oxidoreductase [Myxococcales bacterium]|nr:SDR family NAD(P)-dependent oxidoreductase [Myxococcales bacterium]MCB9718874.1 SDR family NAD(P)-dependent oxidoreductase [Myxococcales bacterium]
MQGKVVVVTGSTSGIGKQIAIGLARRGARVVLAGHDRDEGERALQELARLGDHASLELEIADFSTFDAVRAFAAAVSARHPRIDVLVNNAGVLHERPRLTPEGLDATWSINYLAPFLLSHLLLPRLAAAPQGRIVNTASVAHRWGRLDRGLRPPSRGPGPGVRTYFDTKLAVVVLTRRMATRVPSSVTVNCFHPGVIGTNLATGPGVIGRLMRVGQPVMKTPEQGARTGIFLASAPELHTTSGEYFVDERPRRPSRKVHDHDAAEALWQASVELTGVGH